MIQQNKKHTGEQKSSTVFWHRVLKMKINLTVFLDTRSNFKPNKNITHIEQVQESNVLSKGHRY